MKKIWYIEARDAHTNEVVAQALAGSGTHEGVLCQDGKKRDLWECSYSLAARLVRNRESARLSFCVLYREGKYGPVKFWPFLTKKKRTLRQAVRAGVVFTPS